MNTSNQTSTNVSTLPTAAKAQTVKEVIAENTKLFVAQLEAGHSEGFPAHLTTMGRFQLQLRQHPRDRTAEARCHPGCRTL